MVVLGQDIVEQGPFQVWSRQFGWQTERVFTGTLAAIRATILQFQQPGEADEIQFENNNDGTATIRARYNTDGSPGVTEEVPTTLWELLSNGGEKSIYEHPRALALPLTTVQAIKIAVESNGETPYTPTGANDAWLYDRAGKGQDKFTFAAYSVRLTQTVGNTYSQQIADNNVLQIYTTTQLTAEADSFSAPMPARFSYKINQIPEQTAVGFLWGWLKQPSNETQIAGGKIQIVTEYWLELWDTTTYSVKT